MRTVKNSAPATSQSTASGMPERFALKVALRSAPVASGMGNPRVTADPAKSKPASPASASSCATRPSSALGSSSTLVASTSADLPMTS